MMPMGKNQRVKDVIERQKAELVATARELEAVKADRDRLQEEDCYRDELLRDFEAVKAERDSLRTAMAAKSAANEDLRARALNAESQLRRVKEALDQVAG